MSHFWLYVLFLSVNIWKHHAQPVQDVEELIKELTMKDSVFRSLVRKHEPIQTHDTFKNDTTYNSTGRTTKRTYFYQSGICVQPSKRSIHEQFLRLQEYNPFYVASSKSEAVLFPNLNWDPSKRHTYMFIVKHLGKRVVDSAKGDLKLISHFKRHIENRLGLPHYDLIQSLLGRTDKLQADNSASCTFKGDLDIPTKSLQLCSSCNRLTILSNDIFPQFLNQVTCESQRCLGYEGVCKTAQFKMVFLRKTGKCKPVVENGVMTMMEEWEPFTQSVGSGCECRLKENSLYKALMKLS